jgi:hypothetical protein
MEAKIENELIQLNIGVNFRSKIVDTECASCVSRMTGLRVGEEVQIYPHTVNSHCANIEPKTVTVRKLKNQRAYGSFVTIPLKSLDLKPEQLTLLTEINSTSGKCDACLTFVRQSCCTSVLERSIGLKGGLMVKFYPYTLEVFIEESKGAFSVLPLITIAVRPVQNHLAYGDFSIMNVLDLNLNYEQKAKLKAIINDSLSKFALREGRTNKGARFLLSKLKDEIDFLSEDILMSLEEEVVNFPDEDMAISYPYKQ